MIQGKEANMSEAKLALPSTEAQMLRIHLRAALAERDEARARNAELEGALSAWQSFDDLLRSRWGRRDDELAPAFADRLVHEQAAELGRLRSLERNVRVAARDSSALDEVDARILAALEEFDRAQAQAEPQDGQRVYRVVTVAADDPDVRRGVDALFINGVSK